MESHALEISQHANPAERLIWINQADGTLRQQRAASLGSTVIREIDDIIETQIPAVTNIYPDCKGVFREIIKKIAGDQKANQLCTIFLSSHMQFWKRPRDDGGIHFNKKARINYIKTKKDIVVTGILNTSPSSQSDIGRMVDVILPHEQYLVKFPNEPSFYLRIPDKALFYPEQYQQNVSRMIGILDRSGTDPATGRTVRVHQVTLAKTPLGKILEECSDAGILASMAPFIWSVSNVVGPRLASVGFISLFTIDSHYAKGINLSLVSDGSQSGVAHITYQWMTAEDFKVSQPHLANLVAGVQLPQSVSHGRPKVVSPKRPSRNFLRKMPGVRYSEKVPEKKDSKSSNVIDPAFAAAAKRKEKIQDFTAEDISDIVAMIRDVQENGTNNNAAFVHHVETMVAAANHQIEVDFGNGKYHVAHLTVKSGNGAIQWQKTGGSRGFLKFPNFRIVPDPKQPLEQALTLV